MAPRYKPGSLLLETPDVDGRLGASPLPISIVDSGGNAAGNGGDGHFAGSALNTAYAGFTPINMASGYHGGASAEQTNTAYFGQATIQAAGVGGGGGDDNIALGGGLTSRGVGSSDLMESGHNSAGNGGDGHFAGALVNAPVAVYAPLNLSVAGPGSSAYAEQSNTAQFHQGSIQIAGVGGDGGSGNAASGGSASHSGVGAAGVSTDSDVIATGHNDAGNGGSGHFSGSLVHASFALYHPINIAVAGFGSSATAEQVNEVTFEQDSVQIAGVGGQGGSGNAASGGGVHLASLYEGLIGSDVISTGGNNAGNGGDGHFFGSLVDVDIAIYAPINVTAAGFNSNAEAHQVNEVHFEQGAMQIAGVGGNGGSGNVASGGDFVLHLLADHHVFE